MRFVVLHHTAWPEHPDHYDLMLQIAAGQNEDASVLKTFATLENRFPEHGAHLKELADHRRAYLKIEGALSQNRGSVQRVDEGELQFAGPSECLEFTLAGTKLKGRFHLSQTERGIYILEK